MRRFILFHPTTHCHPQRPRAWSLYIGGFLGTGIPTEPPDPYKWGDPMPPPTACPEALDALQFCRSLDEPPNLCAALHNMSESATNSGEEASGKANCRFIDASTRRGRKRRKTIKRKRKRHKACNGKQRGREANTFVMGIPLPVQRKPGVFNLSAGYLQAVGEDDDFAIIWDTGASMAISFSKKEDFINGIDWFQRPSEASGIARGRQLLGKGMVRWQVCLNDGYTFVVEVEAYYCPQANRRLLSPQQLLQHLADLNKTDHQGAKARVTLTANTLEFTHGKQQI